MAINALPLNCTLKADFGQVSSADAMIAVLVDAFGGRGVTVSETVRVAALNIRPGATSDEGESDDWPDLRERILAHDILILGGPIWLGQISSIAKRVLQRMDAFLSETDEQGQMPSYGKVAVAAIVGNEDGAHFLGADLPSAQRRGMDDPGRRRLLLGWRSNGICRFQGSGSYPGQSARNGGDRDQ